MVLPLSFPNPGTAKKGTAGYGGLTGGTHNYADGTIPPNLLRYGKHEAGTNVPGLFESL